MSQTTNKTVMVNEDTLIKMMQLIPILIKHTIFATTTYEMAAGDPIIGKSVMNACTNARQTVDEMKTALKKLKAEL